MAANPNLGTPGRLVDFAPPGVLTRLPSFDRWFQRSAACLLAVTAAAKLLSASGTAKVLELPDPLLGLATRQVLILVGLLEIAIALAAVCVERSRTVQLLTGWLSFNFLLYRISLAILSPGKLCPCLGSVTEKLNINAAFANYLLVAIALYLFLGSAICYWRGQALRSLLPVLPAAGPAVD